MKIFDCIHKHLPCDLQGIFVEIGSDRYEGSTALLAELAKTHNTQLISIDISTSAQDRLSRQFDNVEFIIKSGSCWAQEHAKLNSSIAVLYLDNFDYQYDVTDAIDDSRIQQQIASYADHGMEMNNVNCQIEHMKQLLALMPSLNSDSLIIFDDTYQQNGCWVGKCGPCVIYLLCMGYQVLEWTTDCQMIMKKNIDL